MESIEKRDATTASLQENGQTTIKRQKTETTEGSKFSDLLQDLQLRILEYLTEMDLAEVACTSRQFRELCKHPSLPQERWGFIRIRRFTFQEFIAKLGRLEERRMFARFPYIRLKGINLLNNVNKREITPYIRNLRLSITRLDLSEPYQGLKSVRKVAASVPKYLAAVMPNLRHVNLTNLLVTQSAITDFARNCKNLQRFVWNSCNESHVFANGWDFQRIIRRSKRRHALKVKELYMDDSLLYLDSIHARSTTLEEIQRSSRVLYYLRYTLRRISIKNLTLEVYERDIAPWKISQDSLMEMVRCMPRLVWFRSDLSAENIEMLKAERPEITFVSD